MGTTTLIASKPSVEPELVVEKKAGIIASKDFTIDQITNNIDQYSVRLEKTVPSLVSLNQDFSYNYVVTAKDKLKKVVVKEQIPSGSTYVSSSPTAEISEDTVTWTLYNLEKGEIVPLELVINASTVSDLSNQATIEAYTEALTTISVGVPELTIQTTTILESVLLNTNVPWKITVANTGTFFAENVVITDTLPDGLVHASGENNQVIEIGHLVPGDSREIILDTTAIKTGELCNLAVVTASNAESVQEEACIIVLESGLEVSTEGPEKQFVGKTAVYTIDVVNTGDIAFEDVIITSIAPPEGKLVRAQEGAVVEENTATWTADLGIGDEKSFEVELLVIEEGSFCNKASVSTVDSSLIKTANACTSWGGYPALLIEVLDTNDPLVVGEETTYIIQIANQGTAADSNVKLDIQIPKGLSIISIAGDTKGTISKNKISFEPYPTLRAKEIIQFRVTAKATEIGDLRFKAKMSSDLLKVPVPEEESTQVY